MKDSNGRQYSNGTLFIIEKLDRFNERKSYAENIDQKFSDLSKFLARAFREYIDSGLKLFIGDNQSSPLLPYDPAFQIPNNHKEKIIDNKSKEEKEELNSIYKKLNVDTSFKGTEIEIGEFTIDGHKVFWSVYLAPKIVRLKEGFGGENLFRRGDGYLRSLNIVDNEGKISFLKTKKRD